jgi:peptidoglycan/LPS O-acetylase OafA/YrhL
VAVVAVILDHAADLLPDRFMGVDVFFVISGFVITASLQREYASTARISLRSFYRQRIQPLTPALTVAVSSTVIAGVLLGPINSVRATARTAVAATLLSANVQLTLASGYFERAAELNPLLHVWSLSLEEQFYLVFPIVVVLLYRASRRNGRPGRTLAVGLGALSALSLALSSVLTYGGLGPIEGELAQRLAFFMMPARAWQFGAGGLVALAARPNGPDSGRSASALAAMAVLLVSMVVIDDSATFLGVIALLPTIATVVLLRSPDTVVGRSLSRPAMTAMGDAS